MSWIMPVQIVLGQCCEAEQGTGGISGPLLLTLAIGTWFFVRWAWPTWTARGVTTMNRMGRVAIVVLLAAGIAGVVIMKRGAAPPASDGLIFTPALAQGTSATMNLPRILDLGATQCIPCKLMAPILEELKKEYAGKMQVDFIDVWKDEAAGVKYAIDGIPTQIFFDASGKELFRHQGFMPKEDILAKCKELGFDLK